MKLQLITYYQKHDEHMLKMLYNDGNRSICKCTETAMHVSVTDYPVNFLFITKVRFSDILAFSINTSCCEMAKLFTTDVTLHFFQATVINTFVNVCLPMIWLPPQTSNQSDLTKAALYDPAHMASDIHCTRCRRPKSGDSTGVDKEGGAAPPMAGQKRIFFVKTEGLSS